jgi:hypothetical protein
MGSSAAREGLARLRTLEPIDHKFGTITAMSAASLVLTSIRPECSNIAIDKDNLMERAYLTAEGRNAQ